MKVLHTDCLVIGGGIAGCVYAHQAAKKGLKTMLLCCGEMPQANSDLAQGGIVYEPHLNMEDLLADVKMATAGMCNAEAVKQLSAAGCKAVEEVFLKDLSVPFDRDENHQLRFTREGAHRKNRIIYSKDTTGHAMLNAIQAAVRKNPLITVREFASAIDLLTLSHSSPDPMDRYYPLTVFGAYVLDNKTGDVFAVTAKKTVLATGGVGQVYRHTTNADHAYGHGIAMAYRVGARVMNMEFVQFHPTALAIDGEENRFLISEAVRGEGAKLVDADGVEFMHKYHEKRELAPRDIVTRANFNEMLEKHLNNVYLNATCIDSKKLAKRFPNISKKCLENGIDIAKDFIPVAPAAHYFMGGVKTNIKGETTIQGLYAIGETASTGLHGANRLASNSLLECVVCAYAVSDFLKDKNLSSPKQIDSEIKSVIDKYSEDSDFESVDLSEMKNKLKEIMWKGAGIVRSEKSLSTAIEELNELQEKFGRQAKCLNKYEYELKNMLTVAKLIATSALQRKESRGAHYRLDYPNTNEACVHSILTKKEGELDFVK